MSCSSRSMAKRAGTYTGAKVADFQAVQIKVARARCLIDSARYFMRESAIAFQAAAERNEVPDLETKLRYRAHSAFAVNQSREAVETLWSCYGAQGLYTRDPLQRHLRDVLAINQHFSFNFDIAGSAFGLSRSAANTAIRRCKTLNPQSHIVLKFTCSKKASCAKDHAAQDGEPSQLVSATPSFFEYPTAPKSSPRGICSKAALYQRLDAPRSVAGFERMTAIVGIDIPDRPLCGPDHQE